jgi:FkbM family methyltransferase
VPHELSARARRLSARARWFAGYTAPQFVRRTASRLSPRRKIRREMSRETPPRGPRHERLQRRYRAFRLRRFLAPNVKAGQLVFDIGANVGEWTAVLLQLGAEVVTVEPQASCVNVLRARFGEDPKVRVVESAVGERVGTGVLHPAVTSSEHASMSDEWRQAAIANRGMPDDGWLEAVEVPLTTIDSLIADFGPPAFCKIDVEGLEAEVLSGVSRPLPAVAFEFHHEMLHVLEQCVGRLAALGGYRYRVFLDEWPDPAGDQVAADAIVGEVAKLSPAAWGMILARRT